MSRHATTAVGFDLDSTIANTEHRRHLMPHVTPGKTWDDYAAACMGDAPMEGTIAVMAALWPLHQIHIVSGRSASAEDLTRSWLSAYNVRFDYLHLRGPGDITSNGMAKAEYLLRLRERGVEPLLFFEDWPGVAEVIRDHAGVPVVLVNAGHGEYESGAVSAAVTP